MAVHVLGNLNRQPVKCTVRVGAEEKESIVLNSLMRTLLVSKSRNEATKASLKLESQLDNPDVWSILQGTGDCAVGDPIIIEADFGSRREQVMRGRIRSIGADETYQNNSFALNVECQDESMRLQKRRIRKIWGKHKPVSDQFILSTVLAKYGLNLDPRSAMGSQNITMEQNATDYDFLRQRAEANCYELLFGDDPIYFGPMRLDSAPQRSIQVLGAQANCGLFSVRQYSKKSEPIASEFKFVCAEGELDGAHYRHVLNIGRPVEVKAVDENYSGVYYVDTVSHSFIKGRYRQDFNLLRQADADSFGGDYSVRATTLPGSLYYLL